MTTQRQSAARADYLTHVHLSLVALIAEDRRADAAALLDTLTPDEQTEMWIRGLWDTALLARGLGAHLGIEPDRLPDWLRSFGRDDEGGPSW